MTKTIEEAANEAIIDNNFFMADPNHPEFVDRGLEQMRACKWVINHISPPPLAQRLTAEEKERVRKMYAECELIEMDDSPNLPADRITEATAKIQVLESIFGTDFFKEK